MDLTPLTGDELNQLAEDILAEQRRRADVESIPLAMHELNQSFLAAEGTVPGQEWRQPVGSAGFYPLDWEVAWNGKTWRSTTPFNVWEPGVAAWTEVVPEGAPPPEWVQPDSTNPYKKGDRVTFEGQIWESVSDGNVWSPTGYPQGWTLITE